MKKYKKFEDYILTCEADPRAKMHLKNGKLEIIYPSLLSRIRSLLHIVTQSEQQQCNELANYLLLHQRAVQKAFWNMYKLGRYCAPAQKHINDIFEKAGIPNPPNFLEHCTSQWMTYLFKHRKRAALENILLPGSHDSGAYKIDFKPTPAFYRTTFWKWFYKTILQLPIIKQIVTNWTVTQRKSIFEQLKSSVRLFDFRAGQDHEGTWYLSHTFLSTPLDLELQQVKTFLNKHPGECLVINIKIDFPYCHHTTTKDIENMFALIKQHLGKNILSIEKPLSQSKCAFPINKNVILYVDLPENLRKNLNHDSILGYQDKSNEKCPNTTTTSQIASCLKKEYEKPDADCRYDSFTTTPTTSTIACHLHQNLIERGIKTQRIFRHYVENLLKKREQPKPHGYIFDAPTDKTIAYIIEKNEEILGPAKKPRYAKHYY